MFDHDCSNTPMGYYRYMKALARCDANLGGLAISLVSHEAYHNLITDIMLQKPDLYSEIYRLIVAMEAGEKEIKPDLNGPTVVVRERAYAILFDLRKNYACKIGFLPEGCDVSPSFSTAYVHMNIAKPVWGLPQELMRVCDRLAWDVGTTRKWTFGFDNRIMVADIPNDSIEYLLRQDAVRDVVIAPIARILSDEKPPYNPNIAMEDWGITRINPIFAWARNNYGQGIKVCVVDTGIRADHPAFWNDGKTNFDAFVKIPFEQIAPNKISQLPRQKSFFWGFYETINFKGGYNFIANSNNPADDHDHGTFCCSIVGGQQNGLPGHYHGVAPGADLYACKCLDAKGSGSYANIAAGMDWGRTHGMDILSCSLGGENSDPVLQAAADNAWYAGLLVVCAAGNSGPGPNTVGYPGAYASTVAVAASDINDNIAEWSSRGPQVEVTAPGRAITGAWAGFTYESHVVAGSSNQYMCASGTSAACPHVAGAAVLIKSWYPLATNVQIRQWLRDYAIDI